MLPTWDPNRLVERKPFNVALVGGRKMGKSTAQQDFICFIGSAACNPCLEHLLRENWDDRFFFSEWDDHLITKLLRQQEELLAAGKKREVLLFDLKGRRTTRAYGDAGETFSNQSDDVCGLIHFTAETYAPESGCPPHIQRSDARGHADLDI